MRQYNERGEKGHRVSARKIQRNWQKYRENRGETPVREKETKTETARREKERKRTEQKAKEKMAQ